MLRNVGKRPKETLNLIFPTTCKRHFSLPHMLKKIPRTIVCVAAQGEELGKDGIEYVLCDKTCNRCIVISYRYQIVLVHTNNSFLITMHILQNKCTCELFAHPHQHHHFWSSGPPTLQIQMCNAVLCMICIHWQYILHIELINPSRQHLL